MRQPASNLVYSLSASNLCLLPEMSKKSLGARLLLSWVTNAFESDLGQFSSFSSSSPSMSPLTEQYTSPHIEGEVHPADGGRCLQRRLQAYCPQGTPGLRKDFIHLHHQLEVNISVGYSELLSTRTAARGSTQDV